MPHLTMEYSANLDARVDLAELCTTVQQAIMATGLFELGAVRVRTLRADHYAVADRLPANGFIDMVFRISTGRRLEDRKAAGEAIFAAATKALGGLFETPHFALSLEVREIDPALSWKKNSIHLRLRTK